MGTQSLDVSQFVPTPAPAVGDTVQVIGVNPTITAWAKAAAQGPVGPQGPPGPQGVVGPAGPEGDAGPAGQNGDDGPQGPVGPQGGQGAPGSDGADGAQGPMGPEGDQGAPGVIGTLVGQYTSPSGPLPPNGLLPVGFDLTTGYPSSPYQMQASQGLLYTVTGHVMVFVGTGVNPTGWVDGGYIQGPAGPQGPEGIQGPPGTPGPQGIMGPQGAQGAAGAQGIPGPAGVQGPGGTQGPAGSAGPSGPAGPQGAQGPPGPVEEAPLDGLQYARENGGWLPTAIRQDAPSDGLIYGRQDADWVEVQQPLASDDPPLMDGVADPGVEAVWARGDHVHPTDDSLMPFSGGVFTGNVAFDAVAFFDAPANLDIGGGGKGDVLSTDGNGVLSWTTGGGVTVSATAPATPFPGQLWYDSVGCQLYVWYSDPNTSQWVIGVNNTGGPGPQGATGPQGPQGIQGLTGGTFADAASDGSYYARVNAAWGKVLPLSGGTLTGGLGVTGGLVVSETGNNWPTIAINKPSATPPVGCTFIGNAAGVRRWQMDLGDNTAEGGSNAGSNFALSRWSDTGVQLGSALSINRATGAATFTGAHTITGNTVVTGTLGVSGNLSPGTFSCNSTVTIYSASGSIAQATGGSFMVQTQSGQPFITFHIPGAFAANFGMDSGGYFYTGGWSAGANAYRFYSSRDGAFPGCDYRIKKDVEPLPSTWDQIKALNPISYSIRDFSPPDYQREGIAPVVAADDREHWGFIAHELQETLLETAAHGVKDDPALIQAPTMLPIVAALTKALQEAMARIEALEARLA